MAKSDYLENALLNHVLRNAAYTPPTTVYVGLYTSAPSDAGGGTEVSGNNYSRQEVIFSGASGGATGNSDAVSFPTPSGNWGTVTHFGLFDADSAGNLLYWGSLTVAKTINSGDTVTIPIGDLDVSED